MAATHGRYREAAQLSTVDAAYIAGLIDGEGTVTLSRRHATDRRQLVVSIANTEIQLLEFVLERVGAGKITRKKVVADHHTPSATYSIANRQALDLLGQTHPFMRSYKRDRTALVLDLYQRAVPRNGKYTHDMDLFRSEFEHRFFSIGPSNSRISSSNSSLAASWQPAEEVQVVPTAVEESQR
jgi:hypothetical protein